MSKVSFSHVSLLVAIGVALAACERPPVETAQLNFRGLGTEQVVNPRLRERRLEANQAPKPLPPVAPSPQRAGDVYQNVQVLGHLSTDEFLRLMAAITQWVSPQQGCTYCHAADGLASDAVYTKVVARRMIQMTQAINGGWDEHVKQTGVTCYTCHRGQPVPANYWVLDPGPQGMRMAGYKAGQNSPSVAAGLSSLPYDPFGPYLLGADEIRVQSMAALPTDNARGIKDAEWTYGLMMSMSNALGVNCTYCHNSRSFMPWESSTPARVTAWHGIRMVRQINNEYLVPLTDTFPVNRKGPEGDVFKVNCATCHNGLPKPLAGVSMLGAHPELAGVPKAAVPAAPAPAAPAPEVPAEQAPAEETPSAEAPPMETSVPTAFAPTTP